MGRPTEYSIELADSICERIADGESLKTICHSESMPCMSSIFNWLRKDKEFVEKYARAKEAQVEALAEELLDIADDATNDWMDKRFGETEVRVIDNEAIQRSKLRVDTRKWLMSKLQPKKYGEKLDLNHGGSVGVSLINSIPRPERG